MSGTAPSLPRRRLLAAASALAVARPCTARSADAAFRFVSPPDSPAGVADAPYWVALRQSYFGALDVVLDPGPAAPLAGVRPVDRGQATLGATRPEFLGLGLEQGMRLVSVWQAGAADQLALAFRHGSAVAAPKDFGGKTLLLDSAARRLACDLLFAQAGLQPGEVSYVEAGPGWAQALAGGQGDAALGWEGLRAQWAGQGLGFDYLHGKALTRLPGRCLVARTADLADPAQRARLAAFLRGWAMGAAFAARNPRAAAAIVGQNVPGFAALPPPVATAALLQVAAAAGPLGAHDADSWARLLQTQTELGQTGLLRHPADVVSNDLVAAAGDFDRDAVLRDADAFTLPPEFALVDPDTLGAAP